MCRRNWRSEKADTPKRCLRNGSKKKKTRWRRWWPNRTSSFSARLCPARLPGEVAQHLITKEMVESMRPGSVIVDVSIDQGGNCELTVPGKDSVHRGVYICGIKNIPGSLPVHSSWLYANNIYYFVENLFKNGAGEFDMNDEIIRGALVTHKGKLWHKGALKAMGQVESQ